VGTVFSFFFFFFFFFFFLFFFFIFCYFLSLFFLLFARPRGCIFFSGGCFYGMPDARIGRLPLWGLALFLFSFFFFLFFFLLSLCLIGRNSCDL
jgi:hypothetical protein